MPAVGVPSFGGRPNTPKEHGRHSSYPAKDVEPPIQPLVPSLERPRRSREYYLEGGDLFVLVSFLGLLVDSWVPLLTSIL